MAVTTSDAEAGAGAATGTRTAVAGRAAAGLPTRATGELAGRAPRLREAADDEPAEACLLTDELDADELVELEPE
ncbi:MAG: hypothetical protein KDB71_19165 [Mycobacterium sp.]|nr:hypothetical protein [Mycobacterium sp.]